VKPDDQLLFHSLNELVVPASVNDANLTAQITFTIVIKTPIAEGFGVAVVDAEQIQLQFGAEIVGDELGQNHWQIDAVGDVGNLGVFPDDCQQAFGFRFELFGRDFGVNTQAPVQPQDAVSKIRFLDQLGLIQSETPIGVADAGRETFGNSPTVLVKKLFKNFFQLNL